MDENVYPFHSGCMTRPWPREPTGDGHQRPITSRARPECNVRAPESISSSIGGRDAVGHDPSDAPSWTVRLLYNEALLDGRSIIYVAAIPH